MNLVGFVIRIYHDAPSPELQIRQCERQRKHKEFYSRNKFEKLVNLVGFVIRIYDDAPSSELQIRQCETDKGNIRSFIPEIYLRN